MRFFAKSTFTHSVDDGSFDLRIEKKPQVDRITQQFSWRSSSYRAESSKIIAAGYIEALSEPIRVSIRLVLYNRNASYADRLIKSGA